MSSPPPSLGPLITNIIYLLIVGIVFYVIWLVAGMLVQGVILSLIGIVLLLLFCLYALRLFGVVK